MTLKKNNIIDSFIQNYKVKLIKTLNDPLCEKYINKHCPNIFVINLNDNIFRRNYISVLFKKYNINYTLVCVERVNSNMFRQFKHLPSYSQITSNELGCFLSHLWCLSNIVKNNYSNAIIFEDDIIFHKNFHQLYEKYFTDVKVPYDFFMLGASDFDFADLNHKSVNNNTNLYRPDNTSYHIFGAHAIYYSLTCAKYMLDSRRSKPVFFDHLFINVFNQFPNSSFICYPNLVLTEFSTTNLNHIYAFNPNEDLYYKNCFINLNFHDYNFFNLGYFIRCQNLEFSDDDTYESYLVKCLHVFFNGESKSIEKYKTRMALDFFTIDDLRIINCDNVTKYRNLCVEILPLLKYKILPNILTTSKYESIFIDFRCLPNIETVIRNAVYKLGDGWSHTVICGNQNVDFMKNICSKISTNIKIIQLNYDNVSIDEYNKLLLSSDFWNMFHGEKLLIYQEDAFIFKNNISEFLHWDYIGAPFLHEIAPGLKVGNGGLSLRTKSKMLECLQNNVHNNINEDVFFAKTLFSKNPSFVANFESAKAFSTESIPNPNAFGGHKFWISNLNWNEMIKKSVE